MEAWKKIVLECLEDLSNNSGRSSPLEAINGLFDDSGLLEEMEKGMVFSKESDRLLRELNHSVSKLKFDQGISKILSTTEWSEVVRIARLALQETRKAIN